MRRFISKYIAYFAVGALLTGCYQADTAMIKAQPYSTEMQRVASMDAAPQVIDLKTCTRKTDGAAISAASLSLLPNGDMVFSGALAGQNYASLARINLVEMSMRTVTASALATSGTTLSASTADNRTMAFYATRHGYFIYTSPTVSYSCDSVTTASILSTSSRPQ